VFHHRVFILTLNQWQGLW